MRELSNLGEDESTLMQSVVSEFRAHNDYWVREGAICSVPCGDLPNGTYLGRDKGLFQLCLEIRALSWKMIQLRLKTGEFPQTSAEAKPSDSIELDSWNLRCNEYYGFCNLAIPIYESRLGRLADFVPHTLQGLARKAAVIQTECLGS